MLINIKLKCYSDDQFIIQVIFQAKMQNILWFQLVICEGWMFFLLQINNQLNLIRLQTIGQPKKKKRQSEDISMGSKRF